ncbi:hypothetical protein CHU93_05325 [Sandarakinorhabdus cyanobacteriorum]|uniref:Uncharacterized protein n=1 Tax=Sandarakinorhabdus cyanobacteriorum TaxID=1981098 RepID=A0A255YPF3_9SPHN|nr:hypothetical protein CHU93_05325 [Sandarakinorhabdus cyanobacteriorum]
MQPAILTQAPRCQAKTLAGTLCQAPAVSGRRRCRMHGRTNPGPPIGNRNAWKHGARSAEKRALLATIRELDRF